MKSKIEQIDLGNNVVRTCLQGAKTLVVSFEGGGDLERQNVSRNGFGQKFIDDKGFDALFVIPKKFDWYQTPEILKFFKLLRREGFFVPYERIITYGPSMGGYAAIAFSSIIGATDIIAFSPRTTLDDQVAKWKSAVSSKMDYARNGPLADALSGLSETAKITVFYDPFFERDRIHALRILDKVPDAQVVKIPFGHHSLPIFLRNTGLFKEVFDMTLEAEFDSRLFYEKIRIRKSDAAYLKRITAAVDARKLLRKNSI